MGAIEELRAAGHRVIERHQRELPDGTIVWWFESAVHSGKHVVSLLMPCGQEMSTLAESPEEGLAELLLSLDGTVRELKNLALSMGVAWVTVPDARRRH